MKKNNGKKFEQIIKSIQQVLNLDEKYTVVKSNIKLDNGKRGEIDILIVKQKEGKESVIAVECKDYKIPVSVVDAFYGKCHRLSKCRSIDQIMIVARGFQSGAIQAAEDFGIELCSLEEKNGCSSPMSILRFKSLELFELRPYSNIQRALPIEPLIEDIGSKIKEKLDGEIIEFNNHLFNEGIKQNKFGADTIIKFQYCLQNPIISEYRKQTIKIQNICGRAKIRLSVTPISSQEKYQYNLFSHTKRGKALYVASDYFNVIYTHTNNPTLVSGEYVTEALAIRNDNNEIVYITYLPPTSQKQIEITIPDTSNDKGKRKKEK